MKYTFAPAQISPISWEGTFSQFSDLNVQDFRGQLYRLAVSPWWIELDKLEFELGFENSPNQNLIDEYIWSRSWMQQRSFIMIHTRYQPVIRNQPWPWNPACSVDNFAGSIVSIVADCWWKIEACLQNMCTEFNL